jgi:chemotaxis protein histidine kinase CheA
MLFSLFVEVNDTCCAFPVELLNESMDYGPSELLSSLPSGVKTDEYVGLYSLRSVLWGQEPEFNDRNVFHLLRFKGEKGKSMAFVVDEYSSLEEAIVQSVDSYIATLPGIQGATVRKDGSVGLVLNPEKIIEQASRSRPFAFVKLKERDDSKDGNFTDYLKIAKAS